MTPLQKPAAKIFAAICTFALLIMIDGCGGGVSDPAESTTTALNSTQSSGAFVVLTAARSSADAVTSSLPSILSNAPTSASPSNSAAATYDSAATSASARTVIAQSPSQVTHPAVAAAASQISAPPAISAINVAAKPEAETGLLDWATPSSPATNGVPPAVLRTQQLSDVIAYVSANHWYPIRNIGLQCQGANATLADVPGTVQHVNTSTGQRATRFGVAGQANQVFRLELGDTDLLPSEIVPRCELLPYPMPGSGLPVGETFWMSYSLWIDDWADAKDDVIIGQMHIQDKRNILLNPFVGLVVRGKEMTVELRHNPLATPSQATTTVVTAGRVTLPTRRWFNVSIRARTGETTAAPGFFQMWLNDAQVVDYVGPLGYAITPDAVAYAKVGIYHWLNGNPWDSKHPVRSMMIGALLVAREGPVRRSNQAFAAAVAIPVE